MIIDVLDKIIEAKRIFDEETNHNLFIIKNIYICRPSFDHYVDKEYHV